ncbi:MAG: pyridoxal-phosphate dependent enzyme [Myxococcales bacterium]|nr:pyridoxal-phosphate dependent enzyme [Myxococcales bacterium]
MSVRKTPLVRCAALEREGSGAVFLKLECLQRTGSFKLRGATQAIAHLGAASRSVGVVTASAGNHGAGLALAGGNAGVAVTVVVPERTPENKQQRMLGLKAELLVQGADYDESERIARRIAKERGATFVSAFDDENVIWGNGGTLGVEIREQLAALPQEELREAKRIVVPVGGGGLIAGLANELCPAGVDILGCQPINNCAMYDSLALGHSLCEYEKDSTVAEGCEGAVCERTYAIVAKHELSIVTVSEEAILDAVRFLYNECGVVAEASAAVAVAALRSEAFSASGVTVVVISGGNIDAASLDTLLGEGV